MTDYFATPITPEELYRQDQLKLKSDMCWWLHNELRYESVGDIRERREKQKKDQERREETLARRRRMREEYQTSNRIVS